LERNSKENSNDGLRSDGLEQLWQELGIDPPQWEPDENAPAIDQELIRDVVQHRATEAELKMVANLAARFRSWTIALHAAIIDS
jgi:hypothetical protein